MLTALSIHDNLTNYISNKHVSALITSDQSAVYDMINHDLLRKKLAQIGIKFSSINLIMDFATNRSQFTQINSQNSKIKKCKNIGVLQGSNLASLLYLIYSLDINFTSHIIKHTKNIHENNCSQTKIEGYVDDTYGTIRGTENNIWQKIQIYIKQITNYYKK